ncbi:helix-turn-helix domain-containing protein [Cellulomonas fimi]|uniref:Helix-turn-helix domain-containing protein n=1 Tax=Cellulomonas fimi TaxID=1708 RepID=A0A7Y0QIJ8_CELFI|nr:helix-turn-helix domain-containing protein [Cellulomonas fimi]NMR20939.1 helix-turn-helix domain-containing protein [Cellulomonas fimi]
MDTPATTTLRLIPRRRRPDGTSGSPSQTTRTLNVTVRPDTRLLLSVEEAAERLDIGRTLLYELIAAGQVQTIHVGRLHKVPVDSLREFVDRQRALANEAATRGGEAG